MSLRNFGFLSVVIVAIFFISLFINNLEEANGKAQNTHSVEHGIGITSPLSDCLPETGCTPFSSNWPALYTQMVSARSFVLALDAEKIDPSGVGDHFQLSDLITSTNLPIESIGHSRVTVGFDTSDRPINEFRIHILLTEPLTQGRRYVLDIPLQGLASLEFAYQPDFTSPSIQVNQLGYLPNADKQAFAGNWLGTAGPMPVEDVQFAVILAGSGNIVFQGELEKVTDKDAWSGNAVYRADFSAVQNEGEYILSIPGLGKSHTFSISKDVFKPVFHRVFRLFYHSRNSTAISAPWADPGYERPAGIAAELSAGIHPAVAASAFSTGEEPDSYKRVRRGWFDAGDYGQYVVNAAPVWYAFGAGMDLMPDIFSSDDLNLPESNNNIPDSVDELEWGMDWLLTMQNPGNGGVYSRSVPVLWDDSLPQDVVTNRYLFEITSHATASFAAMTALHSRLVEKWNPQRAALVLTASRAAWEFLQETDQWPAESALYKNPKNVHAGEYADDSATDNRLWAAAELYRVTGEVQFKTAFIELFGDTKIDPTERVSFKHQAMAAFWSMYQALRENGSTPGTVLSAHDTRLRDELAKILISAADWLLRKADEHPFGAPVHQYIKYTGWGSFAHSSRAVLPLMQAWSITGDQAYCKRSAAMSNPQLGANPQSISYITGVGKRSPRYPLSLLSKADSQVAPLNGIPVNGPHYHLPAIWPSTRSVNDAYIPANDDNDGTAGAYKSYPPLRRYVDSYLLPPMSEPTVAEYALTAVAFGLLAGAPSQCMAGR